ncbi:MAG: hypothetical protein JSV53_00525 [candidate division WOR-3 bacterium]|nr:MAG: hypothetical protein JSV53_00525 [candidate division WOR-3 bacterium]
MEETPEFVRNRIVLHFKDNRLLKGYTHDFTPLREKFHLISEGEVDRGNVYEINCSDLKAVFFVKSLEGNRDYIEKKDFSDVDAVGLRGLKVKVEFPDGEVIRGTSFGYSRGRKGFFVIPVDPGSNNERIYVVANRVRDVRVGAEAES